MSRCRFPGSRRWTPGLRVGLVMLLLLGAAPEAAHAVPGDVMRRVGSPAPCATGLTWHQGQLWVADHKLDALVRTDPRTGRAVGRLRSPGHRPMGLASGDGLLWNADMGTGRIYGLDPKTGHSRVSFEAPVKQPLALAWCGKGLWLSGRKSDQIRLIDPADGTTVRTLPVPGRSADGLVYDGRYLWVVDRLADRVYLTDPWRREVIFAFESPGPHPTGIAYDGKHLWLADYQRDTLFVLRREDGQKRRRRLVRHQRLEFTYQLRNYGPDPLVRADLYLALPTKHPTFSLSAPVKRLAPSPRAAKAQTAKDQWGQPVAHYRFRAVPAGKTLQVGWRARVKLYDVRYFPYPHRIGPLSRIPARIKRRYLEDDTKYSLRHWRIRRAVRQAVGKEDNPYWMARRIYRYIHERVRYELSGGWNVAPRVLARGSGSCSEYSFLFIAMCRAAGIPARYVGSVVVRRDAASWDDVFHRWVEIYLPGFGWLPVDPSRGDKPSEAERGDAFHHLSPDFVVTTQGGGGSRYLRWNYNYDARWRCQGRCLVKADPIAEWSPVGRPCKRCRARCRKQCREQCRKR